jgi:hypothetical protein
MKGFIVLEQTPERGLSDLPCKEKGEDDSNFRSPWRWALGARLEFEFS